MYYVSKTVLNSFSGTSLVPGHSSTQRTSSAEEGKRTRLLSGLHLLAPLILILLNLYCYRHTINGYFLADDFVHIAYLADVFNGHPEKLLENFTGNWMHAWGTQFYRPLISLSLALDFMLGHGSGLPFHISNTIYHIAASIFLYYIACRLLLNFGQLKRQVCALAAAVFFSTCPLHTEVVSWVIGRVDGLCLALFLGAYYLFLRHKQDGGRLWLAGSIAFFVLSLLSKEMAVTLPPLLVLTSITLSQAPGLLEKVKEAFKDSLSYWATLAVYFGVRTAALNTVAGGYDGSVGEGLTNTPLAERLGGLAKLLFPFNAELISPYDPLVKNLRNLYKFGEVFLALRLILFRFSSGELKITALCIAWFLLALVPTYQVFNIAESLMCSRFAYFATVPFCLLLAVLLSPLWPEQTGVRKAAGKWMQWIAVLLIVLFSSAYANTTLKNNRSWADAGKQVREFRSALAASLSLAGPEKNLVLLNSPQRLEGAHMIYNGAMLFVLLSEPLSKPSIADRVFSFEPPTYGDTELINVSRLRNLLKEKPEYQYCYWDIGSARLLNLNLDPQPAAPLSFALASLNDSLIKATDPLSSTININSAELQLNAASVDFVSCDLTLASLPEQKANLNLFWASKNFPEFSAARCISLPAQFDGKQHTYVFPVSERKSWLAGEIIQQLRLQIPTPNGASNGPRLGQLKINSAEGLMPELKAQNMAVGLDGINRISEKKFEIRCDASRIPGCQSIRLELSKPNSWFEHYSGTLRDRQFSEHALKNYSKDGSAASFDFTRADFPTAAYYELRAFALDKDGKVIGFCSDPVNLQID